MSLRTSSLVKTLPLLLAVVPGLLWADGKCPLGNATQSGTYVLQQTGTIAGVGPMVAVGVVFYDGQGGGMLISGTLTVNGTTSTLTNVPATYTVNRDCTGTKTVGTGPSAFHYSYVISPNGSTITFVQTDTGVTSGGAANRFGSSDN